MSTALLPNGEPLRGKKPSITDQQRPLTPAEIQEQYPTFPEWFRAQGGEYGRNTTVPKQFPQGTALYYDDSYGPLLEYAQRNGLQGQPGVAGAYENILKFFKGKPQDLKAFLNDAAPFVASNLATVPSFQRLQGAAEYDPLSGYGAGAGEIARTATAGRIAGERSLANSGLGRSAASATLARSADATAGAQSADLYSKLYGQREAVQRQAASEAFDAHRLVASLALGQNPAPRLESDSGDPWSAVGGGLGALLPLLL